MQMYEKNINNPIDDETVDNACRSYHPMILPE